MTAIGKQHMTNNFSFELDHCQDPVVYKRLVQRLTEIDLSLAQAVAEKCGAETTIKQTRVHPGHKTENLGQFEFPPEKPSIESRRIAILIGDGYGRDSFEAVINAIQKEGVLPFPIANQRQLVKARPGGKTAQPSNHFNGMGSTLFDEIFIADRDHFETLISNAIARHYVREAFCHKIRLSEVLARATCLWEKRSWRKSMPFRLLASAPTLLIRIVPSILGVAKGWRSSSRRSSDILPTIIAGSES